MSHRIVKVVKRGPQERPLVFEAYQVHKEQSVRMILGTSVLVRPGDWVYRTPDGKKGTCPGSMFDKLFEPIVANDDLLRGPGDALVS